MNLDEYLHKYRIHKSFFAKKVGVGRSYLHHIISGIANPSIELANKIVEASNGEVSLEEVRVDKGKRGRKYPEKSSFSTN